MYTRESIVELLKEEDEAVERAILRLAEIAEDTNDKEGGFKPEDKLFLESLKIFIGESHKEGRIPGDRLTINQKSISRGILLKKDSDADTMFYVDQLVRWSNEYNNTD